MQSSYSVIKRENLQVGEEKFVKTEYSPVVHKAEFIGNDDENNRIVQEKIDSILESHKKIAQEILNNAKAERDKIIENALQEIKVLEKEAYERAYEQGMQNGYEDGSKKGYEEAYEKNIEIAKAEATDILNQASDILISSKKIFTDYLQEKKEDIIKLSINIAKSVLKRELEKESGLDSLVEEYIQYSKESRIFVIKCNPEHGESIKAHIQGWKSIYTIEEIHVILDENMAPGNAEIQKDNGKCIVGLDIGLKKVEEALIG
ncbi:FliH/SctL family protein [Clostridium sp. 'White wine YQ']|uniref:FliH/SctL family protein n=1 Tax=Clostridium sp. 'White wine YQ' TaxID=3027474 RepID=UPI002366917F|nr:FliH/SctL family protein [Clostridium sp. 'White wine YQ']MDD7794601.1 FliH/SctL family protein [Clostridium sp. 'White wine YQ']